MTTTTKPASPADQRWQGLRRRDHERAKAAPLPTFELIRGQDEDAAALFSVASQSQPAKAHIVRVHFFREEALPAYCDSACEGYQRRRTCIHTACVERLLINQGRMTDPFPVDAPRAALARAHGASPLMALRHGTGLGVAIVGTRTLRNETIVAVWADGQRAELPHIERHSPTGFEWGYGGAGPADLALSILSAIFDDQELVDRLYQEFKRDVIARLELRAWSLPVSEIREWVDVQMGVAVA